MNVYNVYFSANKDTSEETIERMTRQYVEELISQDLATNASFQKLINKANFTELPDYHLAVFFSNQNHMDHSFSLIREQLLNRYPHNQLMKSVSQFKVSFSQSL